jgi:hypothetical protein
LRPFVIGIAASGVLLAAGCGGGETTTVTQPAQPAQTAPPSEEAMMEEAVPEQGMEMGMEPETGGGGSEGPDVSDPRTRARIESLIRRFLQREVPGVTWTVTCDDVRTMVSVICDATASAGGQTRTLRVRATIRGNRVSIQRAS